MKAPDSRSEWTLTRPQYGRDMHSGGFVEAICPHGIGHHKGVHGCDGCCANAPKELWSKVTDEESHTKPTEAAPPPQQWETELELAFYPYVIEGLGYKLKQFIKNLLTAERKAERQQVLIELLGTSEEEGRKL